MRYLCRPSNHERLRLLAPPIAQDVKQTRVDGRTRQSASSFFKVRNAEHEYARQLRAVSHTIGQIIHGLAPDGVVTDLRGLMNALYEYSKILDPWARLVAGRMLEDVARRDLRAWMQHSAEMGLSLRHELSTTSVGGLFQTMREEEVKLIKSLPIEAGQRVADLTAEAITTGTRAKEIAQEIMRSGEVTKNRATLIARTEVAKTASTVVQARAVQIGSEAYIWRTVKDASVRPSHRQMEGKLVQWSAPPTLDNMTGHAGHFPNCRCSPQPLLPG